MSHGKNNDASCQKSYLQALQLDALPSNHMLLEQASKCTWDLFPGSSFVFLHLSENAGSAQSAPLKPGQGYLYMGMDPWQRSALAGVASMCRIHMLVFVAWTAWPLACQ